MQTRKVLRWGNVYLCFCPVFYNADNVRSGEDECDTSRKKLNMHNIIRDLRGQKWRESEREKDHLGFDASFLGNEIDMAKYKKQEEEKRKVFLSPFVYPVFSLFSCTHTSFVFTASSLLTTGVVLLLFFNFSLKLTIRFVRDNRQENK